MYILLTGVSHKTTPLAIREKFAFSENQIKEAYDTFQEESVLHAMLILSTCNRTEIYAVTPDISVGQSYIRKMLARQAGILYPTLETYFYEKDCFQAVEHIFRVAAGLDSMILGETQILGQLKTAYQQAYRQGASDGVMNQLMQRALHVGKKVRSLTAIDQHAVSVSYIAVEMAKRLLTTLQDKRVLVVGAGETGQLTARYLLEQGVRTVMVSNRSYEKAEEIANCLGGKAVRFDQLAAHLNRADIVISCTSANHYVIHGAACRQALKSREGRCLLFIDIAVPRDVDPQLAEIKGVHIYDIDALQQVLDQSRQQRQQAAQKGEKIVETELKDFQEWTSTLHMIPVVRALKQQGEMIKKNEVQRALNRLGQVSSREERILNEMAAAIVNQLLRSPVERLKEKAIAGQGSQYAVLTRQLFDLPVEGEETSYVSKSC